MLLALPGFKISTLIFLFFICVSFFAIGNFLNNNSLINSKRSRVWVASFSIAAVIILLSFFKYSYLQELFSQNILEGKLAVGGYIFIIGISYLSFKMMHFLIESFKKNIKGINFLNFLNYIFFFSSFISGPINRYNQFSEQLSSILNNTLKEDLKAGSERIIHGLFKKIVLCTILYPYTLVNIKAGIADAGANKILLGLYAYTLFFYFDFSGYTDIALGSARIMGLALPENFNNPFMKKNIQQLWANWHMSLTGWLTDYIYWPLCKKLRKLDYMKKNPILLSNISIIVTFIICGMWHGETANFIIWGAYQGVGLAVLNIYQKYKRKVRNEAIKKYYQSKYSEWVGIIGTFHFFVFGILIFSLELGEIKMLVLRFW